jgi:hypothetical protein
MMLAEYLEHALQFEQWAKETKDGFRLRMRVRNSAIVAACWARRHRDRESKQSIETIVFASRAVPRDPYAVSHAAPRGPYAAPDAAPCA